MSELILNMLNKLDNKKFIIFIFYLGVVGQVFVYFYLYQTELLIKLDIIKLIFITIGLTIPVFIVIYTVILFLETLVADGYGKILDNQQLLFGIPLISLYYLNIFFGLVHTSKIKSNHTLKYIIFNFPYFKYIFIIFLFTIRPIIETLFNYLYIKIKSKFKK